MFIKFLSKIHVWSAHFCQPCFQKMFYEFEFNQKKILELAHKPPLVVVHFILCK